MRIAATIGLLFWIGGLSALSSCNTKQQVIVCKYGLDPITQKCSGVGQPDTVQSDGDSPGDSIANTDGITEDATEPPYECTLGSDSMHLKIGEQCASHGECSSCFCYNEAYMAPFRFCSQPCESGQGSDCPFGTGEFDQYTCLRFAQQNIDDYQLSTEAICMPVCQSVSDCAEYSPSYNFCTAFDTKWDGKTISGRSTCKVQ